MQRHLINFNWIPLVLLSGIWLVAAPAAAQTYKWTDAEGKIHYSDQPPPANVKDQTTVTPRKPSSPNAGSVSTEKGAPAAKARTYVEQEAEFKKRQVEAAEREAADKKKAGEATEKKQNCEQARSQLKSLQTGGRMTRSNAQGEREYLSDAQIAQEIERSKKAVDGWCNN
jgi:hypothetical protein